MTPALRLHWIARTASRGLRATLLQVFTAPAPAVPLRVAAHSQRIHPAAIRALLRDAARSANAAGE